MKPHIAQFLTLACTLTGTCHFIAVDLSLVFGTHIPCGPAALRPGRSAEARTTASDHYGGPAAPGPGPGPGGGKALRDRHWHDDRWGLSALASIENSSCCLSPSQSPTDSNDSPVRVSRAFPDPDRRLGTRIHGKMSYWKPSHSLFHFKTRKKKEVEILLYLINNGR